MANRDGIGHLLLGQPEISEQLMRALDIKGDSPRLLDAAYSAQVIAEDLTRPEFDYLRRLNRFAGARRVGPVVGQFPQVVLGHTPAFAGRSLIVMDMLTIENSNAAALQIVFGLASVGAIAPDPAFPGAGSDDRLTVAQSIGCVGAGANAVSPLATISASITLPASTSLFLPITYVLTNNRPAGLPQRALYVVGNATNTGLGAAFWWRERVLLGSEL